MYWERLSTLKLMKKNNYYQHFLNVEKQLLHNTYITNISYIHTMPDQQSTSIQRHDADSLLSKLRLNIVCPHGNYTSILWLFSHKQHISVKSSSFCWTDARRPVPRLWIRSAEVRSMGTQQQRSPPTIFHSYQDVARPGIEPRTSDLRVGCPTDCATRPGSFLSSGMEEDRADRSWLDCFRLKYSRLSLSRLRLSRITAYLEVNFWSLF